MKLFDYSGAIHFHSEYSYDGRIPVPDILKAAAEVGIDILLLTDHETLTARDKGEAGWHGETLLIVGEEVSPYQFNHLLVFGVDRSMGPSPCGKDYLGDLLERVQEDGGIGLIAHPDHGGTEMFHVKQFPWERWDVVGYAGMSIWDFMTDWQASLTGYCRGLIGYFFPVFVLKGPKAETLRRWDALNQQSRIVGFGELDNHDTPVNLFGLTFSVFPFRKAFRFVSTHLLLEQALSGEAIGDTEAVLNALKRGRAYASLEFFAPARGFEFTVTDKQDRAFSGDEFRLTSHAVLEVSLPRKGKIRVIKDGKLFWEGKGVAIRRPVSERGVYRVEAYLKRFARYRPWIYSNPIYVR